MFVLREFDAILDFVRINKSHYVFGSIVNKFFPGVLIDDILLKHIVVVVVVFVSFNSSLAKRADVCMCIYQYSSSNNNSYAKLKARRHLCTS